MIKKGTSGNDAVGVHHADSSVLSNIDIGQHLSIAHAVEQALQDSSSGTAQQSPLESMLPHDVAGAIAAAQDRLAATGATSDPSQDSGLSTDVHVPSSAELFAQLAKDLGLTTNLFTSAAGSQNDPGSSGSPPPGGGHGSEEFWVGDEIVPAGSAPVPVHLNDDGEVVYDGSKNPTTKGDYSALEKLFGLDKATGAQGDAMQGALNEQNSLVANNSSSNSSSGNSTGGGAGSTSGGNSTDGSNGSASGSGSTSGGGDSSGSGSDSGGSNGTGDSSSGTNAAGGDSSAGHHTDTGSGDSSSSGPDFSLWDDIMGSGVKYYEDSNGHQHAAVETGWGYEFGEHGGWGNQTVDTDYATGVTTVTHTDGTKEQSGGSGSTDSGSNGSTSGSGSASGSGDSSGSGSSGSTSGSSTSGSGSTSGGGSSGSGSGDSSGGSNGNGADQNAPSSSIPIDTGLTDGGIKDPERLAGSIAHYQQTHGDDTIKNEAGDDVPGTVSSSEAGSVVINGDHYGLGGDSGNNEGIGQEGSGGQGGNLDAGQAVLSGNAGVTDPGQDSDPNVQTTGPSERTTPAVTPIGHQVNSQESSGGHQGSGSEQNTTTAAITIVLPPGQVAETTALHIARELMQTVAASSSGGHATAQSVEGDHHGVTSVSGGASHGQDHEVLAQLIRVAHEPVQSAALSVADQPAASDAHPALHLTLEASPARHDLGASDLHVASALTQIAVHDLHVDLHADWHHL